MKKIVTIILSVLLIVCLSACGYNKSLSDTNGNDGRMNVIFNDGFAMIYVDTETGVQYFSRADCGTCVMVDENGDPLILTEKEN